MGANAFILWGSAPETPSPLPSVACSPRQYLRPKGSCRYYSEGLSWTETRLPGSFRRAKIHGRVKKPGLKGLFIAEIYFICCPLLNSQFRWGIQSPVGHNLFLYRCDELVFFDRGRQTRSDMELVQQCSEQVGPSSGASSDKTRWRL